MLVGTFFHKIQMQRQALKIGKCVQNLRFELSTFFLDDFFLFGGGGGGGSSGAGILSSGILSTGNIKEK